MTWLAIFIGGGLGSLARFGISKLLTLPAASSFPYSTLTSNILSSLILGLFLGLTEGRGDHYGNLKFFVTVGFCGGFSTFSTFSSETFFLIKSGLYLEAILSALGNFLLCLLMIGAGMWVGKSL